MFTARVRMATLWSLLPVKYCMAAPKLSRRQRAHVHLQAFAAHLGAGLVLAAAPAPRPRAGMATKRSSARGGVGAGDQQVEIAHGLASAPQAAGGGDGFDARRLARGTSISSAAMSSA